MMFNKSISDGIVPLLKLYQFTNQLIRKLSEITYLSQFYQPSQRFLKNWFTIESWILKINITFYLSKDQYGFRKKTYLRLALIDFTDKISTSLENIGVFLDLAKAFDTLIQLINVKNCGLYTS